MVHIDGFEQFGRDQAPSNALTRAQYTVAGAWSVVAGRNGPVAVAARGASLARKMVWSTNTCSFGFAHVFDDRGSVCSLKVGEQQVTLWMNPDTGLPQLNDQAGGALPTKNRWYFYEAQLNRSTGVLTLAINNRVDMSYQLALPITAEEIEVVMGYLAPSVYRPGVVPAPTDNATKTYDDFYVRDGVRLGPIVVTTRFPTTDQHVEWFKAAVTGSHNESLSKLPPQPLDNYVAANVVGAEDRFTSNNALTNANPVLTTGVVVLARKAPTLDARLGVFVGGAASEREASTNVDGEWRTHYIFFDGRAPDTPASILASEFGFTVSPP